MGVSWHARCFVCRGCKKGFAKGFLNVAGVPYHPECAPDTVETDAEGKTCAACKELVTEGRLVRAAGAVYHGRCWRCFACSKEIGSGAYDTWEGQLCHADCMPNPVCSVCRKPIEGKALVIENKTVHEDCLRCWECQGKFDASSTYAEVDGRLYHERCRPAEAGFLGDCEACGDSLRHPAVEVEGRTYHKGCFVCKRCEKPFVSEYTRGKDGAFLHKECRE